ncbi:hypothetical protein [Hahella ganghwensis]|uniref:hypothetical protein n=1 Tax=Hahella ganghwensis TaxID=286420 RepID=UPI00035D11C1|nr:hypothetical protein [Hahella ganghwensis]
MICEMVKLFIEKNDAIVLILGRLLQMTFTFISIKVITNTLPVDEVGFYYLVLSIIGFATMTFMSPAGVMHSRKINILHDRKLLLSSFLILFIYGAIISIVVAYPLLKYLRGSEVPYDLSYLLLLILTLDLTIGTVSSAIALTFNMLFDRVKFVLYTNLSLWSGLVISVLLTNYIELSSVYWLLGVMLGKLISCSIILFDFFKNIESKINFYYVKKIIFSLISIKSAIIFCIPIALGALGTWFQNHYYRFYIEHMFDREILAIIGLGFSLSATLSISLESVITQYFVPTLYKKYQYDVKNFYLYVKKLFNALIILYMTFFVFVSYFAPVLIDLVSNETFKNSSVFLMYGLLIDFLRVNTRLFSHILYLEGKTTSIMRSSIIGAGALAALLAVGIYFKFHQIEYVVISLLISVALSFFVIYKTAAKISGFYFSYWRLLYATILTSIFVSVMSEFVGIETVSELSASIGLSVASFIVIQRIANSEIFILIRNVDK